MAVSPDTNRLSVAEKTKAHMFEPFFTSKRASGGAGLGLSVVYNLVNHVEGNIEVESEPGEGLTYTFEFPELNAA